MMNQEIHRLRLSGREVYLVRSKEVVDVMSRGGCMRSLGKEYFRIKIRGDKNIVPDSTPKDAVLQSTYLQ